MIKKLVLLTAVTSIVGCNEIIDDQKTISDLEAELKQCQTEYNTEPPELSYPHDFYVQDEYAGQLQARLGTKEDRFLVEYNGIKYITDKNRIYAPENQVYYGDEQCNEPYVKQGLLQEGDLNHVEGDFMYYASNETHAFVGGVRVKIDGECFALTGLTIGTVQLYAEPKIHHLDSETLNFINQ